MARLRNAPSTRQPATDAPKTRQALREKTNTTRSTAPVYDDDGETEHLVKDAKPKRGRAKKAQQLSDELVMAGGLGGAAEEVEEQPASEVPTTTDELAKSDGPPPPVARPNRRPPRTIKKVVQSEAQSKVIDGLKQRMAATARGQRAKQTAAPVTSDAIDSSSSNAPAKSKPANRTSETVPERSEFSLSPSPPRPGKLSAVKGRRPSAVQPGSVLKAQSTPAVESSILALKNFKRRPRQPSMLQMVQQRTASARPSMAHTTADDTAVEDPSALDLDLDLDLETDEEDDFAPEAEGTPLNAAKNKRGSVASVQQLSSARSKAMGITGKATTRKRKSDELDESSFSSRMQQKRRKSNMSSEAAQPVVQNAPVQSSSERAETPQPPATSDVLVANSPSSTSTPPTDLSSNGHGSPKNDDVIVPSTAREQDEGVGQGDEDEVVPSTEPQIEHDIPQAHEDSEDESLDLNTTMAEPLDSSPIPTSQDHVAYPATQVTPPPQTPKAKKKTKPVSTALLQSLLPKRRQPPKPRHRKSEYDLESDSDEDAPLDASHLEEDEDELGGRLRRQVKPATTKKSKTAAAKRGRPRKATVSARGASAAPQRKASAAPSTKAGPRTYGRSAQSDKENDDYESADDDNEESTLPEVSITMDEVGKGKELEEARRKFADVDDWEMEYESISAENHRSSSPRWR